MGWDDSGDGGDGGGWGGDGGGWGGYGGDYGGDYDGGYGQGGEGLGGRVGEGNGDVRDSWGASTNPNDAAYTRSYSDLSNTIGSHQAASAEAEKNAVAFSNLSGYLTSIAKIGWGFLSGNPVAAIGGVVSSVMASNKDKVEQIKASLKNYNPSLTDAQAEALARDAVTTAMKSMSAEGAFDGSGKSGSGNTVDAIAQNTAKGLVSNPAALTATADAVIKGAWDEKLKTYDMASITAAMKAVKDVDTDIEYNHTLADLSGIGMDANEKALLNQQKQIAMDRAIGEIQDTFSTEGESLIAQQIYNLGTNALGGTIGQEFVKRWQEREVKAKTNAMQDIESSYLAAERSAIDKNKQLQTELWGQEYNADVKSAELALDKTKAGASLQYQWDQSNLDRLAQLRGQDITAEQANLDRLLQERMGNTSLGAWEDANKYSAIGSAIGNIGSIASGVSKFGDIISSWL